MRRALSGVVGTPIEVNAGAFIGDAAFDPNSAGVQPGFVLFDRTMIAGIAAEDAEEGGGPCRHPCDIPAGRRCPPTAGQLHQGPADRATRGR